MISLGLQLSASLLNQPVPVCSTVQATIRTTKSNTSTLMGNKSRVRAKFWVRLHLMALLRLELIVPALPPSRKQLKILAKNLQTENLDNNHWFPSVETEFFPVILLRAMVAGMWDLFFVFCGFRGLVDDVAIFQHGLSQAEVMWIFLTGDYRLFPNFGTPLLIFAGFPCSECIANPYFPYFLLL